jgi:hypothetical protein
MASGFGLDSANGALMISSDQPILAWSRTYNQAPDGIAGQSIPAVPVGMATETTEWKRLYTGLNNVEGRSNAGFFNLSDDSITVDITMKDSSGAVAGEGEYELRAGEKKQINDIFAHLGVSAKNGGYYSLMIEGMGDLASYVSIANVLSSDPVYEAGVEEITGGGGGGGGGAACVDIPLVSDGTLSDYDLYAIEEGLTALGTVTIENFFNDTATTEIYTVTDVMVLNFHVVDTRDVVEHYRILDDPMGFDELERVETSSETDNNGSVSTEDKTETYSPAKLRGPVTHACVGQTWTVPSVTLTTDIVGEGSSQESTPTMDGEVVAVDELLTTPAGTFTTLHWREATTSGDDAGTVSNYWNDVATGLLLMSRTQAPNQVIIRELELLSTE